MYTPNKVELKLTKHRILIIGENGEGKTHLAATAPGKVCFIDYQANIEALLKFPDIQRFTVVKGPEKFHEVQELVTGSFLDEFDVVVLDNFTNLSRALIIDVALRVSLKGADGYRPSPGVPILRDYGLGSERLRHIANLLYERSAKQHIIGISHVKIDKDENSGRIFGTLSVPGQVPEYLMSRFTELIYLHRDSGVPKAHFKKISFFPAATRRRSNDEPVKNPDLKKLYDWR